MIPYQHQELDQDQPFTLCIKQHPLSFSKNPYTRSYFSMTIPSLPLSGKSLSRMVEQLRPSPFSRALRTVLPFLCQESPSPVWSSSSAPLLLVERLRPFWCLFLLPVMKPFYQRSYGACPHRARVISTAMSFS